MRDVFGGLNTKKGEATGFASGPIFGEFHFE